MAEKNFDPDKFINCETEQGAFQELLTLQGSQRILAVKDKGGKGKSQLLEKYKHCCRTKHRIPVSLVKLDQLGGISALDLVKIIEGHYCNGFDLSFPKFKAFETARIAKDFTRIQTSIYLQGANFEGAQGVKIASINIEQTQSTYINKEICSFTEDQERLAQDVCVQTFIDEMQELAMRHPIVLMLDNYNNCPETIKDWIENYLFERLFRENLPNYLIIVIAGTEIPNFKNYCDDNSFEEIVLSLPPLRPWTKEHVRQFLCSHCNCENPDERTVDFFHSLIEKDYPPLYLAQTLETLKNCPGWKP